MTDGLIDGFAVEVIPGERAALVVVRGEVDLAAAPALRSALEDALDAYGRVEVDLHDTTFMDSCGLVALVAVHERLGQVHEALVIRDPSPEVRRVMEIAGVWALFDVRTDADRAGRDSTGSER